MPTPSWTYNRLIRNINNIDEVLEHMDPTSHNYTKLSNVRKSLNGLAVMVKREKNGR